MGKKLVDMFEDYKQAKPVTQIMKLGKISNDIEDAMCETVM